MGAVLVDLNGNILSSAHNQTIHMNDPTAHAEILAIRKAAEKIQNYRLPGTTLVSTIEPCIMCMGAMVHARIATLVFGTTDPNSPAYQEAGNWVGILFGIYNGVSAVVALLLPYVAKYISRKMTHLAALVIGGISFLSFAVIQDPDYLIAPMIGVGIAWASILAMPYAMLANSIPPRQMGMFMGLFNMSITIPQIVNGIFGGLILRYFFHDDPLNSILMAGVLMILGGFSVIFICDNVEEAV